MRNYDSEMYFIERVLTGRKKIISFMDKNIVNDIDRKDFILFLTKQIGLKAGRMESSDVELISSSFIKQREEIRFNDGDVCKMDLYQMEKAVRDYLYTSKGMLEFTRLKDTLDDIGRGYDLLNKLETRTEQAKAYSYFEIDNYDNPNFVEVVEGFINAYSKFLDSNPKSIHKRILNELSSIIVNSKSRVDRNDLEFIDRLIYMPLLILEYSFETGRSIVDLQDMLAEWFKEFIGEYEIALKGNLNLSLLDKLPKEIVGENVLLFEEAEPNLLDEDKVEELVSEVPNIVEEECIRDEDLFELMEEENKLFRCKNDCELEEEIENCIAGMLGQSLTSRKLDITNEEFISMIRSQLLIISKETNAVKVRDLIKELVRILSSVSLKDSVDEVIEESVRCSLIDFTVLYASKVCEEECTEDKIKEEYENYYRRVVKVLPNVVSKGEQPVEEYVKGRYKYLTSCIPRVKDSEQLEMMLNELKGLSDLCKLCECSDEVILMISGGYEMLNLVLRGAVG